METSLKKAQRAIVKFIGIYSMSNQFFIVVVVVVNKANFILKDSKDSDMHGFNNSEILVTKIIHPTT